MSPIRIKATSRDLTVNDRVFDSAPSIQDLCEALGSREIADGFDVVIGRRAVYLACPRPLNRKRGLRHRAVLLAVV